MSKGKAFQSWENAVYLKKLHYTSKISRLQYTYLAYRMFVLMLQKLTWVKDLGARGCFGSDRRMQDGEVGKRYKEESKPVSSVLMSGLSTLGIWGSIQPGPLQDRMENTPQNVPKEPGT